MDETQQINSRGCMVFLCLFVQCLPKMHDETSDSRDDYKVV